jgi:TRAP-type C4-dicarboxylate transport system permease small subunit
MVRHVGRWLDLVESLLIIVILLAIAYLSWQALSQAYQPVLKILKQF